MVIHYRSNRKLAHWTCCWAALTCSPRNVRSVTVGGGESEFPENPCVHINSLYLSDLEQMSKQQHIVNNALFIGLIRIK